MKRANRRVEQARKRRDEAVRRHDDAYREYTLGNMKQTAYLAIREGLVEIVKRTERALEKEIQARTELQKKLKMVEEASKGRDLLTVAEKVLLRTDGTVKIVFKGQEYMERRLK